MTNREHDALEAVAKTIRSYDEATIIEAFRMILDRFDYEVVKRDPGPDEENEEFWTERECVDPNCACHRIGRPDHFTRVLDAMAMQASGMDKVIDLTGRLR